MSDKFMYIATGLDNIERARALQQAIHRHGWRLTYDWTVHGLIEEDWLKPVHAIAETQAVLNAHVVGAVLPCGRGTHIEMGVALGAGIPIVLFADNFELLKGTSGKGCIFYSHPLVHAVKSEAEFLRVAGLLYDNVSRRSRAT